MDQGPRRTKALDGPEPLNAHQNHRVLTKVSEGLFGGPVFLSCWQAVGELSASQRHNWQTVVFNVVMVRVSFGERERDRERERVRER